MKFIVSSTQLSKELQLLRTIINNNNTIPILNNFLLKLNKNTLTLIASDIETTVQSDLQVESTDTGDIAVPSDIFLDILKAFPEQPLTLIAKDNNIEIVANNGKYSLSYFSGEDFPTIEEIENPNTASLMGDDLAVSINKTLFATGQDEMRPVMTGILFEFSNKNLTFVATDAHKLVKVAFPNISLKNKLDVIVPKKPLQLLKTMLLGSEENVDISYNEKNIRFKFENKLITTRLIDGKYPTYTTVIPKESPNKLRINRNLLLNSLKRVSIFSNKSSFQTRLQIAGKSLIISTEDLDFNSKAEENLTCEYIGDNILIGFNAKLLIEAISNLESDEIELSMSEPSKAALLYPVEENNADKEIIMLIMPTILNDTI